MIGTPGTGKSWLARRLATCLQLPHVELDAFKLKPGRRLAEPQEFAAAVTAVAGEAMWVLDGNWQDDELLDHAWSRADAIVWVDYPRWLVMFQVVPRSVGRILARTSLYGYGPARLRDLLSPTHPIRWSWRMHAEYRERYAHLTAARPSILTVRITSRRQASVFVEQTCAGRTPAPA